LVSRMTIPLGNIYIYIYITENEIRWNEMVISIP